MDSCDEKSYEIPKNDAIQARKLRRTRKKRDVHPKNLG
jgi:hypothetical protein